MISGTAILLALSMLSALLMGIFVWSRSPGRSEHRAFLLVTINIAAWALGVSLIVSSVTPEAAERWVQITFIIAAFLPATFFFFLELFPRPLTAEPLVSAHRVRPRRRLWMLIYAGSIAVALGALTPLYRMEVTIVPGLAPQVWQGGAVPVAYAIFLVASFCLALARIVQKLRRAAGIERRQVEYVLLAFFASSALAIMTNVLAPLLRIESAQPYGPIFFLLMVGFFGYAMVRYHLLDVWVIVGRTTLYAALTFVTALVFMLSVWLVHLAIPQAGWRGLDDGGFFDSGLISSLVAAALVVLFILPARDRLQSALDRLLVKREYDSNQLMARISREATQMHDLDSLLGKVGNDLYRTVGAEPTRFLLLDDALGARAAGRSIVRYSSRRDEGGAFGPLCPEVMAHMSVHEEPLALEALIHGQRLGHASAHAGSDTLVRELHALEAHLCVPLTTSAGLIGFIALGPKISREAWSRADALVFSTIAAPLATAIANARLYDQLHEANQQRARILAQMRSGVVAVTGDGTISLINESARELFPQGAVGESLDCLPAPVRDALRITLAERREINDYESTFETIERGEAHVVVSTAILPALRAEAGPPGAMALVYDMTQLKRLERNVQRADRLTSIGMLAAGMAHEIKNPLVSIKTFAQLLNDRFEDPEFREVFVELVPQEVDRIDSIVSRLLDFARPNSPRQTMTEPQRGATLREPLDIRGVLRKVLALVENQISRNRIEVETLWPEQPLYLVGDSQQMHQVFLNLVLNAIDAMRESPLRRLRIQVRHERQLPMRPGRIPQQAGGIAIVVEDTGCGILAEHLDQLFTPFFTTKEHGSGLGLAVVHGIIAEHGGQVDAEAPVRGGARFTVILPAVPESQDRGVAFVAPALASTVQFPMTAQRKG